MKKIVTLDSNTTNEEIQNTADLMAYENKSRTIKVNINNNDIYIYFYDEDFIFLETKKIFQYKDWGGGFFKRL